VLHTESNIGGQSMSTLPTTRAGGSFDMPDTSAHVMESAPAATSVPMIARSDPYADLRPFIIRMWCTRESMCRNVFLDDFPRHSDRPATKAEEDEFLLKHFDANTLHMQGGAFLKQALYAIALYHQDEVAKFAAEWADKHHDDQDILVAIYNDDLDARSLFTAEYSIGRGDAFLNHARRIVKRVNPQNVPNEPKQAPNPFRSPSVNNQTLEVVGPKEQLGPLSSFDKRGKHIYISPGIFTDSVLDTTNTAVMVPNDPPLADTGSDPVMAETQQRKDGSFDNQFSPSGQREADRLDRSRVPPRNGYSARQPIATSPGPIVADDHPAIGLPQPNTLQGPQGSMMYHPGPHGDPLPFSPLHMNSHLPPVYPPGNPGPYPSPGLAQGASASLPIWPVQTSGFMDYGAMAEHYKPYDSRQPPRGSYERMYDRSSHGVQLNSANMDPDSFNRLSGDQSNHRPNTHKNGRSPYSSNRYRRSSMHSSEGRSYSRNTPPVFHDKRILSDQTHSRQSSSFEAKYSETPRMRKHEQKQWSNPRKVPNGQRGEALSNSSHNVNHGSFAERGRQIFWLVVYSIPDRIDSNRMRSFLSEHARVKSVRYIAEPHGSASTVLVS